MPDDKTFMLPEIEMPVELDVVEPTIDWVFWALLRDEIFAF